mgnify:CR=1 FL=1
MGELTDSGILIRLAYQAMDSLGVDAQEVLKRIGMNQQQLLDKELRTPHSAQRLFWQTIEDVSGDKRICL